MIFSVIKGCFSNIRKSEASLSGFLSPAKVAVRIGLPDSVSLMAIRISSSGGFILKR
jgi:hypothetical protein